MLVTTTSAVMRSEVNRIMGKITEEEALEVIKECEKVIDEPTVPIFSANRDSQLLNPNHPLYDRNFTVEPRYAEKLDRGVRDAWRMWKGYWVNDQGERLPCRREFKIADIEYDDNTASNYITFERIFGRQCYRLWPLAVLKGPCAWLNRLPQDRKEEHLRWADAIMQLNSMCPEDYEGLTNLNQLPRDFMSDPHVPNTQVYINNLPELQDLELTNMINSFFGMTWPGNAYIISLSLLKQETGNEPGNVSNGLAAVRFITYELAEQFIKLFHGVRIYYKQFSTRRFKDYSTHQLRSNKTQPPVIWHFTTLSVTFTEPRKRRGFRNSELPHHELLHRSQGNKHQQCLWQKDFAAYDYPNWPIEPVDIEWLVDSCSGAEFSHERRLNRDTLPLICAPDSSYWSAMGCLHPKVDLTIKQDSLGCWINQREREHAWEDDVFFTEVQRQQRAPRLNTALPTQHAARAQAGRAVSRAPSRRPYRRR